MGVSADQNPAVVAAEHHVVDLVGGFSGEALVQPAWLTVNEKGALSVEEKAFSVGKTPEESDRFGGEILTGPAKRFSGKLSPVRVFELVTAVGPSTAGGPVAVALDRFDPVGSYERNRLVRRRPELDQVSQADRHVGGKRRNGPPRSFQRGNVAVNVAYHRYAHRFFPFRQVVKREYKGRPGRKLSS